jgi:phosphoribosylformylglycinamidine synthase
VEDVHVGRHIVVDMEAPDRATAERTTRDMCEKLLANPVIEDFEIAHVGAL